MDNATTILIEKKTRKRLAEIGHKGETYDQILNRILDEWMIKGGD